MPLTLWEIVLRVGLALLAGLLIGLERELNVQPAGLRTHVLVAMGACTFTLGGVAAGGTESTRVAAAVATGVGFLGAGVILRDRLHVKGLTTAASLWVAASLGVVAGLGAYVVGFVVTALTLLVLTLARPVARWLTSGRQRQALAIDLHPDVDVALARARIEQEVGPFEVDTVEVSTISVPSGSTPDLAGAPGIALVGEVRLPADADILELSSRLRRLDGVLAVRLAQ